MIAASISSDSALAVAAAKRREGRVFALTLTGGFLFVAGLGYLRGADRVAVILLILASISLLGGLLVPGRLGPVRRGWMRVGEVIGHVTTPVILATVYYGVVTPVAVVRRAAALLRHRPGQSGWHRRPPLPPPARLERQF